MRQGEVDDFFEQHLKQFHLPPSAVEGGRSGTRRERLRDARESPRVEIRQVYDCAQRRKETSTGGLTSCGFALGCRGCVQPGQATQCCRCKQAGSLVLNHVCPKCQAMVCTACLDDFRMFLATAFQCPHCGEGEENRASLQHKIWIINACRSAERLFGSITTSVRRQWISGSTAPGTVGPRQPRRSVGQAMHDPQSVDGDLEPAVPQHGTRLPPEWHLGVGARRSAAANLAAQSLDSNPADHGGLVPQYATRPPLLN